MTTKSDIISKMALNFGMTKTEADKAVNTFLDVITNELTQGNEVNLAGFGKFSVTERAERQGRNPSNGETVTIAASKAVKFKPAKGLKDAL